MTRLRYIILLMVLCVNIQSKAQLVTMDDGSTTAMRGDHRTTQVGLYASTLAETANTVLHKESKDATDDWKKISDALDKYTRAFEILDAIINGGSLVLNIKATADNISDKTVKIVDLMNDYKDLVNRRLADNLEAVNNGGKVWNKAKNAYEIYKSGSFAIAKEDTILYSVPIQTAKDIKSECNDIYESAGKLVLFATGKMACKTPQITAIFASLNNSLDYINRKVDRCYLTLWRYIIIRKHTWTPVTLRKVSRQDLLNSSFSKWKASAVQAAGKSMQ